jgi:hypothetical protein
MARTYGKFILFGDSTVQYMARHHDGFALQAKLQESMSNSTMARRSAF